MSISVLPPLVVIVLVLWWANRPMCKEPGIAPVKFEIGDLTQGKKCWVRFDFFDGEFDVDHHLSRAKFALDMQLLPYGRQTVLVEWYPEKHPPSRHNVHAYMHETAIAILRVVPLPAAVNHLAFA